MVGMTKINKLNVFRWKNYGYTPPNQLKFDRPVPVTFWHGDLEPDIDDTSIWDVLMWRFPIMVANRTNTTREVRYAQWKSVGGSSWLVGSGTKVGRHAFVFYSLSPVKQVYSQRLRIPTTFNSSSR